MSWRHHRDGGVTFVLPFCPYSSLVCFCSPHPVKPLTAAPVEASPDRKQSRTSLSTALSSGLERLKTVTSGGIQSVLPASQLGSSVDTKRLKVRCSKVLGAPEGRVSTMGRGQVMPRAEQVAGSSPGHSSQVERTSPSLETGCCRIWGSTVGSRLGWASWWMVWASLLSSILSGHRILLCWTSQPSTIT